LEDLEVSGGFSFGQGGLKVRAGGRRIALLEFGVAQRDQQIDVVGREFQAGPVKRRGLGHAPGVELRVPPPAHDLHQPPPGRVAPRVRLQRRAQEPLRVALLPPLLMHLGQPDLGLYVFGVLLQDAEEFVAPGDHPVVGQEGVGQLKAQVQVVRARLDGLPIEGDGLVGLARLLVTVQDAPAQPGALPCDRGRPPVRLNCPGLPPGERPHQRPPRPGRRRPLLQRLVGDR
jgi:hypothetical protein